MGQGIVLLPAKQGVVLTPGQTDIIIPAGKYTGLAASGKVAAVSFDAAKVLADTTIAGKQGTMVNRGAYNIAPGASPVTIPQGYHNGAGQVAAVSRSIKSIQPFEIIIASGSLFNTANIITVNQNKSIILVSGISYRCTRSDNITAQFISGWSATLKFNSGTQIQADRNYNYLDLWITGHIIEFDNVASYQTGEQIVSTTNPLNLTINAVDPTKCIIVTSFKYTNGTGTGAAQLGGMSAQVKLTSSTNLQFDRGYTGVATTYRWTVVEFP
jgi:hypothetical protein